MRFTVIGTDAAGLTLEFPLDARSADEAEYIARQRGVSVVKVSLGGAGTVTAARSAGAPAAAAAPASPAPRPGTDSVARPAKLPRARVELGLISLALGGAALLFCWIPTVGVISWPLGAAGLLCGVGGALAAITRPAQPPRRSAKSGVATSVGGAALSVVTLLAAGMLAGVGPLKLGNAQPALFGGDSAPAAPTQPAPRAERPRSRAIVAAATPEGFSPPKAQAPTLPPASPTLKLGDAELRVASADVMLVPLAADQGRPAGLSTRPLLLLRVEVRNTGAAPIEYRSIAGDDRAHTRWGATLKDAYGRSVARAVFGLSIVPLGRVPAETLQPGRSLVDVLVFEAPTAVGSHLILTVPGDAVAASGSGELGVPAPRVQ